MNPSNQKLLKGIKIFFKVVYIILIVVFAVNLLSQGIVLFLGKEQISVLSVFHTIQHPDITMKFAGKAVQPEMLFGIGAVVIKGVPLYIKISNSLSVLIGLFLFILILRTIRLIIKSIDQNDVFSMLNAQRLKRAGFLLLAELIITESVTLINSFSIQRIGSSDLASLIGLIAGKASGSLIAIVFIFFMAAVFKIGVNMQEENQSFV
jgi:hypothetical protein